MRCRRSGCRTQIARRSAQAVDLWLQCPVHLSPIRRVCVQRHISSNARFRPTAKGECCIARRSIPQKKCPCRVDSGGGLIPHPGKGKLKSCLVRYHSHGRITRIALPRCALSHAACSSANPGEFQTASMRALVSAARRFLTANCSGVIFVALFSVRQTRTDPRCSWPKSSIRTHRRERSRTGLARWTRRTVQDVKRRMASPPCDGQFRPV